ncbi:MAG: metallophosphoesterase family protein [Candidatus Hodarchaeales archaeon]|jgi:protein phosphatase
MGYMFNQLREKTKQKTVDLLHHRLTKVKGTVLLVSDIHGHYPALIEALSFSHDAGINQLISLGDIVDYNPHNDKVMSEILNYKHNVASIRGNHENDIEIENGKYYTSHTGETLNPKFAKQVMKLPYQIIISLQIGVNILLCHANPWNDDYVYIYAHDTTLMDVFLEDTLVDNLDGFWFGHTHIPTFYQKNKKFLYNPGSLGVPRGKKAEVTFSWIDCTTGEIEVYKIDVNPNNRLELINEPNLLNKHKFKAN